MNREEEKDHSGRTGDIQLREETRDRKPRERVWPILSISKEQIRMIRYQFPIRVLRAQSRVVRELPETDGRQRHAQSGDQLAAPASTGPTRTQVHTEAHAPRCSSGAHIVLTALI